MAGRTPEISIDDYAAQRARGTTVDVRERMEFAYGHVPGAVWIPMGQLAARLGELDRNKAVHVICTTGNRSKAMADLLVAAGFEAASVATGTAGWVAAGHPVEVGL
ncbi:MAG: rhodanese-like domain-containing protein [Nocardioides sp.]